MVAADSLPVAHDEKEERVQAYQVFAEGEVMSTSAQPEVEM